ncbi:hypothetical protein AB0C81_16930 [Streptomyces roseoverticillatus]|uniref:hypothetical protein n=1 Tax=Streptomyces roseoverticillatus TaxID=66429 RepID=UPI0033C1A0A6
MTTPLRDGSAPAAAAGIAAAHAGPGESEPAQAGPAKADPVKALLQRHHGLCARAVDPLEIAAVLEDGGLTDHAAAECRHRDVFSLADELYARTEREEPARPAPGVPCDPAALAHGPRAPWRFAGLLAAAWLVAYALLGGPALAALLAGHLAGRALPPDALTAAVPAAAALACSLAPALWCARWFTGRVRHALVVSRSRAEFRARAWPLLLTAAGLFTAALATLLWSVRAASGAPAARPADLAAVTALGGLLFLARLLTARGSGRAAAVAALAACGLEAAALGAVALGAGAPGPFAVPPFAAPALAWATGAYGPAAIPLAACALPALALLAHALTVLSRASAHRHGPHAPVPADPGEAPARAR